MSARTHADPKSHGPSVVPPAQRAMLGFGLRFALGWVVAIILLTRLPAIERVAIHATLAHLVALARLLGQQATSVGESMFMWGQSVQIVPDCTPLLPTATLWVAVLAFPATWRWRAIGLAGGALVLWVTNLLRILALFPVLRFRTAWFPFIHIYLWQTVTMLVVLGVFVLWLRLQQPRGSRA